MPARSAALPSCTLRTSFCVSTMSRLVREKGGATSRTSSARPLSPRRTCGFRSGGASAPSGSSRPAPTNAATLEITPEPHRPTGRGSPPPSDARIADQRMRPPCSTHTRSIAPGAARTPQRMCAPSYTGPVAQEVAVSSPSRDSTTSPLVPTSTSSWLPR